jgi:cytochrome c biogenesis protein CcdA
MGNQVATGLKMGSLSGFGVMLVYLVLGIIVIGLLLVGVAVSGKAIEYMKPIVAIILIIMGILTVSDVTINTGYITVPFRRLRDKVRPRKGPQKPTFNAAGLFLYGVGYGSASASCSAPIFIALAVTAVSTGEPFDAVVTFVVFLLSLWILMAIVTILLTVSEEKVKTGLMKHYIVIKKVTGVVFLVAGIYLIWLTAAAAGWV